LKLLQKISTLPAQHS